MENLMNLRSLSAHLKNLASTTFVNLVILLVMSRFIIIIIIIIITITMVLINVFFQQEMWAEIGEAFVRLRHCNI